MTKYYYLSIYDGCVGTFEVRESRQASNASDVGNVPAVVKNVDVQANTPNTFLCYNAERLHVEASRLFQKPFQETRHLSQVFVISRGTLGETGSTCGQKLNLATAPKKRRFAIES